MAAVDPFVIYVGTAVIILLIIIVISVVRIYSGDAGNKPEQGGAARPAGPQAAVQGAGMRRRGPRQRMRLQRQDSDEEEEEMDEDSLLSSVSQSDGKIGAKKMRKLQEKAERKAAREAMEQERQDKKKREQEAEEKRKKQEEIEKKEQAIKEEAEQKEREEKERQEHEEYLKLKEAFSVDEEGQDDTQADLESESQLQEFIRHIKETKVVMLEDLAAHFKLKIQDVIQRVEDLQTTGDLTGVMDDRGKFIFIGMPELEAVAKYVRQHGRVSKQDLAESSNRLINLEPVVRQMPESLELQA